MIIEVFINDLNVRKTRDDCLFNLKEVLKRHVVNESSIGRSVTSWQLEELYSSCDLQIGI